MATRPFGAYTSPTSLRRVSRAPDLLATHSSGKCRPMPSLNCWRFRMTIISLDAAGFDHGRLAGVGYNSGQRRSLGLTTLDTKQHILDDAGFAYSIDRAVYFNRKSKKIFSVAFLEDQSEAEIERLIRDDTGDKEWKFPVGRTERRANAAGRARSRGAQIRRPQPTGSGRARHQPAAHRQAGTPAAEPPARSLRSRCEGGGRGSRGPGFGFRRSRRSVPGRHGGYFEDPQPGARPDGTRVFG